MNIITYNGKWRLATDSITFDWRFDDDDSYMTFFGGMPFYNSTTSREEIQTGFNGYIIDIRLYASLLTTTQLETLVECKSNILNFPYR